MKALTLHQPYASLIAVGAKTIETRSWSTSYRGELAIHAGKRWADSWGMHDLWCGDDRQSQARDRCDLLVETLHCDPVEDAHGSGYWTVDRYGRSRIPLGAVVAMCRLVDVVPIVAEDDMPEMACVTITNKRPPNFISTAPYPELVLWRDVMEEGEDITDQRPFGGFTPGRFAYLLADIEPLAEPIPAKGKQGLWEWDGLTAEGEQ